MSGIITPFQMNKTSFDLIIFGVKSKMFLSIKLGLLIILFDLLNPEGIIPPPPPVQISECSAWIRLRFATESPNICGILYENNKH